MHVQMYYSTQALEMRRVWFVCHTASTQYPASTGLGKILVSCWLYAGKLDQKLNPDSLNPKLPFWLVRWLVEFGKFWLLFVLCLWTDDPFFCAQLSSCKAGAQQCFLWPFHITSSLVSKLTVCRVLTVVGQVMNCCRKIHEHATLQRLPCCFDPEFFYLPFTQKWLLLAFKTTTTKRSSSQRNNSVCLERVGFKCQLMKLDSNCCCVGKEQIESWESWENIAGWIWRW